MGVLLSLIALLGAMPLGSAFDEANRAYESNDYAGAVRQYEAIVAAGAADAALFYNLGNAYFRLGQVAPAIANYERALQRDPRLEPAQANLRYALAATDRNLARPLRSRWEEGLLFWDDALRYGEVRTLAMLSWAAFWAALLWRVIKRHRFQIPVIIVALLAAGAFMTSLYSKSFPLPLAVASQPELNVRTGANPADTVRYTLAPGDRVRVETESNGWLRVATVDGERGWAPAEAFVLVGPPYAAPPQTLLNDGGEKGEGSS
jgi:tetratricopeptide (TPR) repeat protein